MDKNMENNLSSISINQLIKGIDGKRICFIVPSYQRGYRWEKNQIDKLLNDLFEFYTLTQQQNSSVGTFYCLQPIVVKNLDESEIKAKMGVNYIVDSSTAYFEIVDGQQRMTTLFILLKYILRDNETYIYDIEYERDGGSGSFVRKHYLQLINLHFDGEIQSRNCADEYYFSQAFLSIKEWFLRKKEETGKTNLFSIFETIICDNVKVIWYELEAGVDCYEVFKNINNGKIPLTDAELVKAMLLNSKHFSDSNMPEIVIKQEQNRYARLWDEIQRALEEPGFWSFVSGGGDLDLPTHIDFLIELMVKKKSAILSDDDHKFFSFFEQQLDASQDKKEYIESVFEQLRTVFRTLQDWHNNYLLHNYIGYILYYTKKEDRVQKIISLENRYCEMCKTDFISSLIDDIKTPFNRYTLETISYDSGRVDIIERLLMLFNIEELNETCSNFNFFVDKYGWSVEHIKAQHSMFAKESEMKQYLEDEKRSLLKIRDVANQSQIESINTLFLPEINRILGGQNVNETDFVIIAEMIDSEIYGFDDVLMHKLGNLALLSKVDNSSFNNSPFYEKRDNLNSLLQNPKNNVPPSTVKAFYKMYSRQQYSLDFTRWKREDFDSMFSRQKALLCKFIREA